MTLRKATRQKSKIRLGLSAVAGGGKTYSAILIAKGLVDGDLSKVALIDTENGSGDLYSHLGEYNVLALEAPYTPENYAKAIKVCEDAGMEVIIVDSITHEWDGKGGILEIHSAMTGNSFTNWASLTPRHQKFIDAILKSKAHVITTVRRKQDYEMSKDANGKMVIEKAGLKEVTREGFEYELTVNLNLDMAHMATALKDRTGLFMDQPPFMPGEATGKLIRDWCENGIEPIKFDPEKELRGAKNLIDLVAVWNAIDDKTKYLALKDEMKVKLTPKVEQSDMAATLEQDNAQQNKPKTITPQLPKTTKKSTTIDEPFK